MENRYQKFLIHATTNLSHDYSIVEEEKNIVKNLMETNAIDYALEISEEKGSKGDDFFFLELIVSKDRAEDVVDLLDLNGGLGYQVDLDETWILKDGKYEVVYEGENIYHTNVEHVIEKESKPSMDPIKELDDEHTKGINKPKKTIVDYILYLAIIALLIKLMLNFN